MRPTFRHMWLEREGGGFDTINQCLVDPWVQQRANKSWELFASRVNTQTGPESFCGICWTLVWENYDSHVGWDIKQPRWEGKLMRLFSQELNIFSWGLEYLDDSQPLIFATTQTFAQSKSDRRHQGSLQRSTHCCQHREIWWGRVFEVWTLPASCEIWWATYLGWWRWTFAQSEDDKRHFRLLPEPAAVWKYYFSLQTLYNTHTG